MSIETTTGYRALIEFTPNGTEDTLPWRARIYAPGADDDSLPVHAVFAETRDRAEEMARDWATARQREPVPPEWVEL